MFGPFRHGLLILVLSAVAVPAAQRVAAGTEELLPIKGLAFPPSHVRRGREHFTFHYWSGRGYRMRTLAELTEPTRPPTARLVADRKAHDGSRQRKRKDGERQGDHDLKAIPAIDPEHPTTGN